VTTSVVVGVFLFGVLVGRGARETHANEAVPSASATPEPSPMVDSPPPAGDPPPVPDEEAASAGEPAPKEPITGRGAVSPDPIAPAGEASTASPPPPVAAPKAPANTPAAPRAQPGTAGDVPESGRPGTWLVQVIATREQADAASVAKRLAAKGYPAFLVSPTPGARQPFYKVQVGRYKDRGEAEQVSQRIKKEEQFQSWILR
jgi:cell division septation protein DedD